MREELQQPNSDEDSDASRASADAARLHAVARRIQLREHASRQQQLQLHKQLQQQQQLLQQQQQQLHQQDALLRHQEQLLRQQEQQLASRETEAGLLLRQVGLLQQQLEERADRLAAAEGNYLDAAALLRQLQQRVNLGSAARLLVEEVRQQQQENSQHLYAEVRRLKRQLTLRVRLPASQDEAKRDTLSERDKEKGADAEGLQHKSSFDPNATSASGGDQQQQQQQKPKRAGEHPLSIAMSPERRAAEAPGAEPAWCCAEAAEANACVAWGCSGSCCCPSDSHHEAAVRALRVALHNCRCAMESREHREAAATSAAAAAAAGAALRAVTEALHRCPAAGADAEIVDVLLERLRAESMQIRVYAQQRRAAAAASSGSSVALQEAQQGGLATVEELMEREAYDVMGTALPQEVLLPLLAVQNISTLLRLKQQSVLLANSRWLQLLRDTVGSKFLEGSSCCSTSSSSNSTISGALADRKAAGVTSSQLGGAGEDSGVLSASAVEAACERRQHVLLQLLMRGSGGVAAAAGLLRQSTSPLALHAATLTDRESGNNVFHLLCMRDLPQLFATLNLTSLPCDLIYAQNRQAKSPADLLPPLLQPQLLQLHELQQAAAAGELQQQAELQQQVAAVSGNLRAWRSVVFEYAAKASALYRQHNNAAALALYTEALKLQQRLLDKQQQLDAATGGNGASSLSLLENTAKLAFNKARSALRLGRWICCLQSCSLCLSMTPNYKAAYETAAEACEWLLDFEGALNYIQLMRQHCPEAFSADHYHKRRLYEAQLQASSFQVLGIDKGAPKAAVNRAFRRMSIVWHPDKASALSEDLRLRHENHFKRLNEARIALLDPESYARQLLVPVQTLYRRPELLVAPTPPQQATPSPSFLLQPEQLTSEQLQQEQQQQLQQQQREQPQDDQQSQEQEDQPPSLEKLQQQRQQLLRSIGSLQRQQHELQRELEEHHAGGPARASSASASNTLRWQELQKLQQQQHNKQKRLAECEHEIGQWLRRRQHQQQPEEKQLDPEAEVASGEWGRSESAASSVSSPSQAASDQAWRHAQQQQQQQEQGEDQPQQKEREDSSMGDASSHAVRVETSPSSLSSPKASASASAAAATTAATTAATAAATAAAEVIKEAAAAASSGHGKTCAVNGFADAPSPWHSVVSSDSDPEVPTVRSTLFPDERRFSSSSSSSSTTTVPATRTLHPTADGGAGATSQHGSSASQAAAQPAGTAAETGAGDSRASVRAFRSAARGGSRASSAGPQLRTGEAAGTAAAAATVATARRSLTTCICSAAPRRTTAPTEAGDHAHPPRTNNNFWDETDSSGSTSNSSSGSSNGTSGSSSSGSSDDGGRAFDGPHKKRWAAAAEYGREGLVASTPGPSQGLAAASLGSSTSRAGINKPQQPAAPQPRLPVPPPRRLSAAARRHASGSGSSVESRGKSKGLTARRPFIRARDTQQGPQPAQQRQQQQQQYQQQRQQLWPGAGSHREVPAQNPAEREAEKMPANLSAQHATAAAWMRPPDFPEPSGATTTLPQPPHEDLQDSSGRPVQQPKTQHQQQQQQQQRSEVSRGEGPGGVSVRKDVESGVSGQQTSPPLFAPSLKLSHSFDRHRLRQQDLQQAQLLHQQSLHEDELEEASKSARHQLLFPDEELLLKNSRAAPPAAAAVADAEALASMAAASAAASRPTSSGAPANEGPASSGPGWEASEAVGLAADAEGARAIRPDRRFRWPAPSDSAPGVSDANSGSKAAAYAPPYGVPATARSALHTKGASGGEGACTPGAPVARATSGGSVGDSCSSSHSEESSHRSSTNSSRSPSSRSASGAEEPLDDSGDWMEKAPIYKQQHQQQQQQQQRTHQQQPQHQERFYHSVAQETPHQLRSPPEADSIFLMQWGIGAPPQRSSVPLLGRSGSGHTDTATLHKDSPATATPTRLFPQYGPSHLDMQHGRQPLRFAGPLSGVGFLGEGIAAAAGPAVGERGGRPRGELHKVGLGNDNELGAPLNTRQPRSEGQPGGDLTASLGAWEPLLTRASMPHSTEGVLLHSPRTPKL